ncbi:hypothetical protein LIER_04097 [Lithospermum erythrorhizon]|uniref:Uncharacterized protein n=1 Tax=Lithospermum erythrorhizon TaxID=34254 RepID=A0AAV3NVY5_LITER
MLVWGVSCLDCLISGELGSFLLSRDYSYAQSDWDLVCRLLGNMSRSSETQQDNYELQARTDPHHMETSRAGELSQLAVPVNRTSDNRADPTAVARADAA